MPERIPALARPLLLSCAALALLHGCGGGGGSTSLSHDTGGAPPAVSVAPAGSGDLSFDPDNPPEQKYRGEGPNAPRPATPVTGVEVVEDNRQLPATAADYGDFAAWNRTLRTTIGTLGKDWVYKPEPATLVSGFGSAAVFNPSLDQWAAVWRGPIKGTDRDVSHMEYERRNADGSIAIFPTLDANGDPVMEVKTTLRRDTNGKPERDGDGNLIYDPVLDGSNNPVMIPATHTIVEWLTFGPAYKGTAWVWIKASELGKVRFAALAQHLNADGTLSPNRFYIPSPNKGGKEPWVATLSTDPGRKGFFKLSLPGHGPNVDEEVGVFWGQFSTTTERDRHSPGRDIPYGVIGHLQGQKNAAVFTATLQPDGTLPPSGWDD